MLVGWGWVAQLSMVRKLLAGEHMIYGNLKGVEIKWMNECTKNVLAMQEHWA